MNCWHPRVSRSCWQAPDAAPADEETSSATAYDSEEAKDYGFIDEI